MIAGRARHREREQQPRAAAPADVPTDLPTDFPTDFAADVPTELANGQLAAARPGLAVTDDEAGVHRRLTGLRVGGAERARQPRVDDRARRVAQQPRRRPLKRRARRRRQLTDASLERQPAEGTGLEESRAHRLGPRAARRHQSEIRPRQSDQLQPAPQRLEPRPRSAREGVGKTVGPLPGPTREQRVRHHRDRRRVVAIHGRRQQPVDRVSPRNAQPFNRAEKPLFDPFLDLVGRLVRRLERRLAPRPQELPLAQALFDRSPRTPAAYPRIGKLTPQLRRSGNRACASQRARVRARVPSPPLACKRASDLVWRQALCAGSARRPPPPRVDADRARTRTRATVTRARWPLRSARLLRDDHVARRRAECARRAVHRGAEVAVLAGVGDAVAAVVRLGATEGAPVRAERRCFRCRARGRTARGR